MDNRIKILYTIPNFKTAGSQFVLLSIFRKIDKSIFDPYICIEKFPETVPNDILEGRTLLFEWKEGEFQNVLGFRNLLKKHRIDMVHSWDYKSNYLEPLACRLACVKYVYTKKNNAWSKKWKLKSVLPHHITYDNPEMKTRFFNSFLFRKKITFIPHGVDTDLFKPQQKNARETFNICSIGNIGANKNQLFIIEALNNLPENIILHLCGNEDIVYRKLLDGAIEKYGLKNRVHFHGFVKNTEIPEVLKNMDLFVLASFQEGLPVSILEALACGVPVLSSDSGGGARYLLDPEFIFNLESPKELTQKILKMYKMEKPELEEIAKIGVGKVAESYTIQQEVKRYESLYRSLIHSKK